MQRTKNRSTFIFPRLSQLNNKESFISGENSPTLTSLPINNKRLRQFFIRSRNIDSDYDNNIFETKTQTLNSVLSTSRGVSTQKPILKVKTMRKIPLSKIYSQTSKSVYNSHTLETQRKGRSLSLNKQHNHNNQLNVSRMNYNKPFKRNAQRKTILKSLDVKYELLNREFATVEAKTMKTVNKSLMMNLKETQRFKRIHNNVNPYYALTPSNYVKQLRMIHRRVQSLKES